MWWIYGQTIGTNGMIYKLGEGKTPLYRNDFGTNGVLDYSFGFDASRVETKK